MLLPTVLATPDVVHVIRSIVGLPLLLVRILVVLASVFGQLVQIGGVVGIHNPDGAGIRTAAVARIVRVSAAIRVGILAATASFLDFVHVIGIIGVHNGNGFIFGAVARVVVRVSSVAAGGSILLFGIVATFLAVAQSSAVIVCLGILLIYNSGMVCVASESSGQGIH